MKDKMGIGCCALRCDLKKRYLTHKEVLDTPSWCPQIPHKESDENLSGKVFVSRRI